MVQFISPSTAYISFPAQKQIQFGNPVVTLQCPVGDILQFVKVDKEVQRDLDTQKVSDLRNYIEYGLEGHNIYFSPLIFSSRECGYYDDYLSEFKLKSDEKLTILDGQHRMEALSMLNKQLGIRANNTAFASLQKQLLKFPITMQIFQNLNRTQERQLFTDINTKSSTVSKTLKIAYGDGHLYGKMVRELVENHNLVSKENFETRGRSTSKKLMTLGTLFTIAIMLNEGKVNEKDGKFTLNKNNYEVYKSKLFDFITLLVKYAPANVLDRNQCVLLNPGVLLGISRFVYYNLNKEINMEILFRKVIKKADWSHTNKKLIVAGNKFNPNTKKIIFNASRRTARIISNYLEEIL